MKIKLQEFINKSPDKYFTFEGVHYKLHLNSLRAYVALYNQNTSKDEILIKKDHIIEDLDVELDENLKKIVIYKKDIEFINFGYLNQFTVNRELSKHYK